jgi:hypothetical protein
MLRVISGQTRITPCSSKCDLLARRPTVAFTIANSCFAPALGCRRLFAGSCVLCYGLKGCYYLDLESFHDLRNNVFTLPRLLLLSQPFHSSVHHPCSVLVLFRLSHVRRGPHFHSPVSATPSQCHFRQSLSVAIPCTGKPKRPN